MSKWKLKEESKASQNNSKIKYLKQAQNYPSEKDAIKEREAERKEREDKREAAEQERKARVAERERMKKEIKSELEAEKNGDGD